MKCRIVPAIAALLLIPLLSVGAQAATADSTAGLVTTQASALNVRNAPGQSGGWLASLQKGSSVTLLSRADSWWYVEYAAGKYGYCHADYITKQYESAAAAVTAPNAVNVRSGAGTGYSIDAYLSKGTYVVVLSQSGSWSRVLYHGTKTGYIYSAYLSVGSAGAQAALPAYRAIALSVNDYKQYDGRWSPQAVGSSGKTIGQIGCAITALAITESYRTGTAVTPAVMCRRLSYSSGGDVYWPQNYAADSAHSGYLARLYAQLAQGRPVILGAKTAAGSAHWVVVTGYTGGDALSASGFSVSDPGSSWRKTLADLYSTHPYFYKMECYG